MPAARSAAGYPLSVLRATVAPPARTTGGLVAVRLCIEANCSRKAKQRTVLFGEYLARPFKCFALKQDSKGATYGRAAIVAPGYVSL